MWQIACTVGVGVSPATVESGPVGCFFHDFGMKLHVGTNSRRLVRHPEGTAARYRGIGKRAERAHREVSRCIAMNPVRHRTMAETAKARDRCRELERNLQRLAPLPGFSNLMIAQPRLP